MNLSGHWKDALHLCVGAEQFVSLEAAARYYMGKFPKREITICIEMRHAPNREFTWLKANNPYKHVTFEKEQQHG